MFAEITAALYFGRQKERNKTFFSNIIGNLRLHEDLGNSIVNQNDIKAFLKDINSFENWHI